MIVLKMAKIIDRKFNRRTFIKYSLRLSILALFGLAYEKRNNIGITHLNLSFSNLPPALVVDVLSNLKGGDKIAVLGNHDQWDGIETEKRLTRELEKREFVVLRNKSMPILRGEESIHIVGVDDVWFSYNLTKAMRNVPHNAFKILLSHSPDIMSDVRDDMKIDLTITGHTHGGQVAIPYLSHHFIPIDNPSRYLMGLVKEPYGYTYVNRGIGTLVFPFRLGTPPEITCFTLNR